MPPFQKPCYKYVFGSISLANLGHRAKSVYMCVYIIYGRLFQ